MNFDQREKKKKETQARKEVRLRWEKKYLGKGNVVDLGVEILQASEGNEDVKTGC